MICTLPRDLVKSVAEESMIAIPRQKPVFRFAPSPNGPLHLGHALSAFLNRDMAQAAGGRFLLRIEDIDLTRCTPEFEQGIYTDLEWLGIGWEKPVRRQSDHFVDYQAALKTLIDRGLAYPAFLRPASRQPAIRGRAIRTVRRSIRRTTANDRKTSGRQCWHPASGTPGDWI
jgi:glutamyl/glutaminyl-tRNA synthetase